MTRSARSATAEFSCASAAATAATSPRHRFAGRFLLGEAILLGAVLLAFSDAARCAAKSPPNGSKGQAADCGRAHSIGKVVIPPTDWTRRPTSANSP